MRYLTRTAVMSGALAILTGLAACSGQPGEGGATLGNMVLFAGTTVPPAMTEDVEGVYCPQITVPEGGAALQAYSGGRVGDTSGLRNQISLGDLARECIGRRDGTTLVKVGVEGRALLGVSGTPGKYEAPIHITIKDGDTVLATRARRVAASIPPGQTQATFSIVEDNIVVPASAVNSFKIEVGLGAGAASTRRKRG